MSNNQSQFVSFSVTFRGVESHHNNRPVCETLGCFLKFLCREHEIFHILLKIQHLVDTYKRSPFTFVNTKAFFFHEGV